LKKLLRYIERDSVALLALFILALITRLIRLFSLDLGFDEVVLLFQADHTFGEIWNLCKLDNFPPLFPWLVKLWLKIDPSVSWFRLLGALLGSLTPPAAYLLSKEILNKRTAWVVGIATVLSVSLISYSQMVRMFCIQPYFVLLSIFWFIKALQTGKFRYWMLTCLMNLLGYYVYIFMIFIFAGEFLVLLSVNKFNWKKYQVPFIAHIPFFIGVVIWLIPVLQRLDSAKEGFWVPPLSGIEYILVFIFWGTGSDFRNSYFITAILNLSLFSGFFLGIVTLRKNFGLKVVLVIFITVILLLSSTALLGQSFFERRYLLYLLPLYLIIVCAGWQNQNSTVWRQIATGFVIISLILSLCYYYVDYYQMHSYYAFIRPLPKAEPGEGHFLSDVVNQVATQIDSSEVIIHYLNPPSRIRTFYASVYYHHHRFSEHLYSKSEITQYNGRQYLEPGAWIKTLYDLNPLPEGIWLITLDNPEFFSDPQILTGAKPPRWISQENLPLEMINEGYQQVNLTTRGNVSAIHYRRSPTSATP
jgi:uncharacterized membrane protein